MSLMESIWSKYVIFDENGPDLTILGDQNDVISQNLGKVIKFFFQNTEKYFEGVNMVEFD